MPGSKLPPGLKALKTERPDVVAKMLNKPVDEVKKMMEGSKVKMVLGGLLGDKILKKKKKMLGMQDGGSTSTAMKRKNKKKMGKCPRDGIAKTGKTKGRMA